MTRQSTWLVHCQIAQSRHQRLDFLFPSCIPPKNQSPTIQLAIFVIWVSPLFLLKQVFQTLMIHLHLKSLLQNIRTPLLDYQNQGHELLFICRKVQGLPMNNPTHKGNGPFLLHQYNTYTTTRSIILNNKVFSKVRKN